MKTKLEEQLRKEENQRIYDKIKYLDIEKRQLYLEAYNDALVYTNQVFSNLYFQYWSNRVELVSKIEKWINKMLMVAHKNFKCEDCGNDKFTIKDDFEWGKREMTLHCANKDCEASYTFSPEIKLSMSSHPSKRCSCKMNLLSRDDNYCSMCGKKNPHFKSWRNKNIKPSK